METKGTTLSLPSLFRCDTCGRLIRDRDIKVGVCCGHRVRHADRGSLFEWFLVLYWRLTGTL